MYTVNSLESARMALAAGERTFVSPPFAACHAGVGYYRALVDAILAEFPDTDVTFTLCCGEDAAVAYEALRLGFTHILCDCMDGQFVQLQGVAEAGGAFIARTHDVAVDPAPDAAKPIAKI